MNKQLALNMDYGLRNFTSLIPEPFSFAVTTLGRGSVTEKVWV